MKKLLISMGLAIAATLSFTNCSKELNSNASDSAIVGGQKFSFYALTTKTSNDGLNTKWVAADQLTVFHAEAGTTAYGSNDKFTIAEEDVASGKFTGTLTEALDNSKSYDWYALYPYTSAITTPTASDDKGYVTVGNKVYSGTPSAQKQTGNSNKAHLAGENFPLYGQTKAVSATSVPSISLNQICAVIKVSVNNQTGSGLTVSSINFDAPATVEGGICGTYFIDFTGSEPAFTASGANYVSTSAKLNVTDGEEIADKAGADFYIGVKPFSVKSGDEIKISVNGYEKTISLTKNVDFKSGHIVPITFNYDKKALPEPTDKEGYYRVEDVKWLKAGDKVILVSDVDNKAMAESYESNYRNLADVVKSVDGNYTKATLGSGVQVFSLVAGSKDNTFAFKCNGGDADGKYITATSSSKNYMGNTADIDGNSSWAISITGGIANVEAVGTYTINSLRYNSNSTRFSCYANTSTMAYPCIYKFYGKTPCAAPTASVTPGEVAYNTTVELSCTTAGAKIYYTTDGSTPTSASTHYTSAIAITKNMTIKAIATASGYSDSSISEFAYTLPACATPSADPEAGAVVSGTKVTLSCTTTGATIYYTTDGTDPTTSSTVYTEQITISEETTIKAFAIAPQFGASTIQSWKYTIKSASESVYTVTLDSSASGSNNVHWTSTSQESFTWEKITWATAVEGTTSLTASKSYVQIGSKSNPASKITITTTGFAGKTIKSVKVTTYCMSNTGPTLTIKAGTTVMLDKAALVKTTATELATTSKPVSLGATDAITLEFNSSAAAAICFSKIEVKYE